jgi:hypothetical protein
VQKGSICQRNWASGIGEQHGLPFDMLSLCTEGYVYKPQFCIMLQPRAYVSEGCWLVPVAGGLNSRKKGRFEK